MASPTAPDWFRVIADLMKAGLSMREISRQLGPPPSSELDKSAKWKPHISESMLRYYRSGGAPLYVHGEALISLWCSVLGKEVAELPREIPTKANRARKA